MSNMERGPERRAALLEAAAWLGTALLHLALVAAFSEKFAAAWLDVPVLAALVWLARGGRVGWNLPLCLASALCYLLADPAAGTSWSIWFAVVPQFAAVARERRLGVLALQGLWTGWMAASGIYAWILPSAALFFDANAVAASPFYAVTTLLIALQLAAFLPLLRFFADRTRLPVGVVGPGLYALVEHFLSLPTPIALPLGLTHWPVMLQTLDIAGITGTTFLVAAIGGAIHQGIEAVRRKSTAHVLVSALAASALFAFLFAYGTIRMGESPETTSIDVATIQPVSPGKVLNTDEALQKEIAGALLELSREAAEPDAAGKRPDVLFWPEGAAAFASRTPQFNAPYMQALEVFQREAPVTLVAQNIEFFRDADGGGLRYYNAVSVVEPPGVVSQSAFKNILMPFGEYLPLEERLPVLRKWFPNVRSVAAGEAPTVLDGPGARFGPIVCYEVLFPAYVRELAGERTGYLAVLTNDRWYGERQQPPQHFAFAVLRAIENRKPVVRTANSGISALIRADGSVAEGESLPVMERGALRGRVFPRTGTTLYNRWGEFLPRWILAPLHAALAVWAIVRRRTPAVSRDSA